MCNNNPTVLDKMADGLPHDTCQCCNKVYNNEEMTQYGHNNPSWCKQCQIDNAIADIIVSNCNR